MRVRVHQASRFNGLGGNKGGKTNYERDVHEAALSASRKDDPMNRKKEREGEKVVSSRVSIWAALIDDGETHRKGG